MYKKSGLALMLLCSSVASSGVFAADNFAGNTQAQLNWQGVVGGSFFSKDIALTGQGGGDIMDGTLTVANSGTFQSLKAIVVEAHATIDNGDGSYSVDPNTIYDQDVKWNLVSSNVSSTGSGDYDSTRLKFAINGTDVVSGTPYKTTAGNNIVGVTTSYTDAVTGVIPGETIIVTANITAEPDVGEI
ncbi:conserved exported hypothetical protein [Vibrio harveyi]|uniref:hypothetical protein n=1 Tax=Vibrio harveyi TaxID=669 RepID=UPI002AD6E5A8|nr:hypothetical protein [Vibrio harveyi]CAK6712244.1 conserved exported hypothetical protein [Vibrio harveyi]